MADLSEFHKRITKEFVGSVSPEKLREMVERARAAVHGPRRKPVGQAPANEAHARVIARHSRTFRKLAEPRPPSTRKLVRLLHQRLGKKVTLGFQSPFFQVYMLLGEIRRAWGEKW